MNLQKVKTYFTVCEGYATMIATMETPNVERKVLRCRRCSYVWTQRAGGPPKRCPYCKSERIAPAGHVLAGGRQFKEQVRCETCRTVFLVCQTSAR